MVYLVIIFTILLIVLILYIFRIHHEIQDICRQLEIIQAGSHIQLTGQIHNKPFSNLYHQLENLRNEYQQKQMKLVKAEEQLKMTIQNMAHDIRTPLTSSMGYMHMLQEESDDRKKQRYLEISLERMEELKRLLEELFLYTKLISESYILECEGKSIYPILETALLSFYHLFEENNQEPKVRFQDKALLVHINQEAAERVFRNLIGNALFHGSGDLIIIQKQNKIIFKNTIPEGKIPDMEHIFDRFYKADSARNHASSGLGLAIVKEFMEKMDGSAEAHLKDRYFVITLTFKAVAI